MARGNQMMRYAVREELEACSHSEAPIQFGQVRLDRDRRDLQAQCDLFIAESAFEKIENRRLHWAHQLLSRRRFAEHQRYGVTRRPKLAIQNNSECLQELGGLGSELKVSVRPRFENDRDAIKSLLVALDQEFCAGKKRTHVFQDRESKGADQRVGEDDHIRLQLGRRALERNDLQRIFGAQESNLRIRLENLRQTEIPPAIGLKE